MEEIYRVGFGEDAGGGRECRAFKLSAGVPPSQHFHMFTKPEAFQSHYLRFLNEGTVSYLSLVMELLSPLLSREVGWGGGGWKFQSSNNSLVFLETSPHSWSYLEDPSQEHQHTKRYLCTQGVGKILGTQCQESETKKKCLYWLYYTDLSSINTQVFFITN